MGLYALFFWFILFLLFISFLYIRFLRQELSTSHFTFTVATSFTVLIAGFIMLLKL